MKISLSKATETRKKHVVLLCDRAEAIRAHKVIVRDILGGIRIPVKDVSRKTGKIRYRFAMKYLDKLVLTFPHAELSTGVEKLMSLAAQTEYRRIHDNIPDIHIPGFAGVLYDFQKVGVQHIIDNPVYMLNDEMGLGKTIMALAALRKLEAYPALVCVPNSGKFTWERIGKEFFPGMDIQVVNGSRSLREGQISLNADVTVINYEALRLHPEIAEKQYKMVIADEFHRIKNPMAKQTKAFHKIQADRKLLMSGTPMLNGRPDELWSGLKYCWPDRFPSHWLFDRHYVIREGFKILGYRNLDELRDWLRDHSLRRRKDQVLQDLPPRVYSTRTIDMSPEQRTLYREIDAELKLRLADGSITRIAHALTEITRLKQAAWGPELYGGSQHSAKVEELKDIVAELVANDEKAIIFSQWSRATKIMQRELAEYNPAYVDGTVMASKREAEIDKFQTDEDCKVFIGTIGSCQMAITLTAASYVIFTDKGWTPAENEQAAARAHRIGQRNTVNIIELFANNTIEERIERLLERKTVMNNAIVERDGGERITRISLDDIRQLLEEAREEG